MCWDAYDLGLLKQEKKWIPVCLFFKMQFLLKYELFRKKNILNETLFSLGAVAFHSFGFSNVNAQCWGLCNSFLPRNGTVCIVIICLWLNQCLETKKYIECQVKKIKKWIYTSISIDLCILTWEFRLGSGDLQLQYVVIENSLFLTF